MINRETLIQAATVGQTTEINVAREYCQHLFLGAFYQQNGSEQVMFKGGTALKIVHGSPRFSEDLDFSAFGISVHQIESWVLDSQEKIELGAIQVDLQESKTTPGGYLGALEYRLFDHVLFIQIEVSLRQRNDVQGQGVLITPELLPAYMLTLLPASRLVEQKIAALLTCQKPRDFFDLYFMLRKGMITAEMKPHLVSVRDMLPEITMDFKSELSQFLPKSYLGVLRDFRSALSDELRRHGV